MVIVTRRHIREAAAKHKDAATELAAWVTVISQTRWGSFTELKATFPDADAVEGYVVFNIRHNRYRLITVIRYSRERYGMLTQGHVYIRSFLTHKEYENRRNWDRRYAR